MLYHANSCVHAGNKRTVEPVSLLIICWNKHSVKAWAIQRHKWHNIYYNKSICTRYPKGSRIIGGDPKDSKWDILRTCRHLKNKEKKVICDNYVSYNKRDNLWWWQPITLCMFMKGIRFSFKMLLSLRWTMASESIFEIQPVVKENHSVVWFIIYRNIARHIYWNK